MYLLRRFFHMDTSKPNTGVEHSKLIRKFGKRGRSKGCFNMPCGIAITKAGDIVVADTENHRIQIFTKDGILKYKFGTKGCRPEQVNYPMCVAVTNEDNIAVTDSVSACIKLFSQDGAFLKCCACTGILEFPYGLAISYDSYMIVTDICKHCVTVLDPSGDYSHSFGCYGDSPKEFDHPYFVTVNKHKQIIVCDSGNSCIKLFRFEGRLLRTFSLADFRLIEDNFAALQGICSDSDGNTIVICNSAVCIVAKNGRLWEILTPKDGLNSPKCIAYSHTGQLAITQSGFDNKHEVCLFEYNKEDYKSLNTLLFYAIDI